MNLSDLEKQLQELQQIDTTSLTPEQLQELIDKLAFIADMGEEMLNDDIQKFDEEEEMGDDELDELLSFKEYLSDIKDYNNENKSYDETNNP